MLEVCNSKGVVLSELGRYEEAVKCYGKAIELDPLFIEAWHIFTLIKSIIGTTKAEPDDETALKNRKNQEKEIIISFRELPYKE